MQGWNTRFLEQSQKNKICTSASLKVCTFCRPKLSYVEGNRSQSFEPWKTSNEKGQGCWLKKTDSFWFRSNQNSSAVCQLTFQQRKLGSHISQPFCTMVLLSPTRCKSAGFQEHGCITSFHSNTTCQDEPSSEKTSCALLVAWKFKFRNITSVTDRCCSWIQKICAVTLPWVALKWEKKCSS